MFKSLCRVVIGLDAWAWRASKNPPDYRTPEKGLPYTYAHFFNLA